MIDTNSGVVSIPWDVKIAQLEETIAELRANQKILLDAIEPFVKSGWDDLKQARNKVVNEKTN